MKAIILAAVLAAGPAGAVTVDQILAPISAGDDHIDTFGYGGLGGAAATLDGEDLVAVDLTLMTNWTLNYHGVSSGGAGLSIYTHPGTGFLAGAYTSGATTTFSRYEFRGSEIDRFLASFPIYVQAGSGFDHILGIGTTVSAAVQITASYHYGEISQEPLPLDVHPPAIPLPAGGLLIISAFGALVAASRRIAA